MRKCNSTMAFGNRIWEASTHLLHASWTDTKKPVDSCKIQFGNLARTVCSISTQWHMAHVKSPNHNNKKHWSYNLEVVYLTHNRLMAVLRRLLEVVPAANLTIIHNYANKHNHACLSSWCCNCEWSYVHVFVVVSLLASCRSLRAALAVVWQFCGHGKCLFGHVCGYASNRNTENERLVWTMIMKNSYE